MKLDRVAPLVTDPPYVNFTTRKNPSIEDPQLKAVVTTEPIMQFKTIFELGYTNKGYKSGSSYQLAVVAFQSLLGKP